MNNEQLEWYAGEEPRAGLDNEEFDADDDSADLPDLRAQQDAEQEEFESTHPSIDALLEAVSKRTGITSEMFKLHDK